MDGRDDKGIEEVIKRRQAMFDFLQRRGPALSVAEEVSVPDFRAKLKEQGIRSIHLLLHATAQASLQVSQFRLRIKAKADDGAEEIVSVAADDLYCSYAVQSPFTDVNHCSVLYDHDLATFAARAQQQEPSGATGEDSYRSDTCQRLYQCREPQCYTLVTSQQPFTKRQFSVDTAVYYWQVYSCRRLYYFHTLCFGEPLSCRCFSCSSVHRTVSCQCLRIRGIVFLFAEVVSFADILHSDRT